MWWQHSLLTILLPIFLTRLVHSDWTLFSALPLYGVRKDVMLVLKTTNSFTEQPGTPFSLSHHTARMQR